MSEDKIVLCTIYRSNREREMYIYVNRADGLSRLPEELLARLGTTSEVMTIKLTPDRKLARAKAPEVLAAIEAKGFYMQLPPEIQPAIFTLGE
ncbi:MAG: YcgL domain-containing protein [Pseudomonadota bacterium]